MIRVGCSGWSYRDWIHSFYPTGTDNLLRHYSGRFSTVEINTSFYSIPSGKSVRAWITTVSGNRNFMFSVKMPGSITHDALTQDIRKAVELAEGFESSVLSIFSGKGVMGACLIQLPPGIGEGNLETLYGFLSTLSTRKYRYVVEPRNRELFGDSKFAGRLAELEAGYVISDSPMNVIETGNSGKESCYVRLHGRNNEGWKSPSDMMTRYNYSYSEEELASISEYVSRISSGSDDVFVYFNNHPFGNAPRNASRLSDMLGLKGDPQGTLF